MYSFPHQHYDFMLQSTSGDFSAKLRQINLYTSSGQPAVLLQNVLIMKAVENEKGHRKKTHCSVSNKQGDSFKQNCLF